MIPEPELAHCLLQICGYTYIFRSETFGSYALPFGAISVLFDANGTADLGPADACPATAGFCSGFLRARRPLNREIAA